MDTRQPAAPRSGRVEYTSADELVKDVQDLRWLGQGAQGVVYEGCWQGATVAVKFSIVEDLDTTAYELLFSRLLSHPNVVQTFVAKVAVLNEKTIYPKPEVGGFAMDSWRSIDPAGAASSALSPPAVTATAQSPCGCTSPPAPHARGHAHPSHHHPGARGVPGNSAGACAGSPAAAAGCCKVGGPAGGRGLVGGADSSSGLLSLSGGACAAMVAAGRGDSFHSDDGFGDPFGRHSTFTDVREVLASMGAKPGHYITQMVMEHCDHGSLHAAIQRGIFKPSSRWGPKLALRALIRTVREVAQGMFHLHSNNVLHGDLKPANVLLINSRKDRRGYIAKVSDFGLAQFCSQDHISNAPWGTLVYMAPERLLHGQLFPASDVYSFGVMLWEMYHGQRPYEGMHAAQIVMACAQGSAILEWAPDACQDVVRISRRCTSPSIRDRPTFDQLMRELAHLESRVRLEGPRISTSLERPSDGPAGLTAALRRAATAGNPQRASTESSPPACAAIPGSRRCSHERPTAPAGGSRGPAAAAPGPSRLSADRSRQETGDSSRRHGHGHSQALRNRQSVNAAAQPCCPPAVAAYNCGGRPVPVTLQPGFNGGPSTLRTQPNVPQAPPAETMILAEAAPPSSLAVATTTTLRPATGATVAGSAVAVPASAPDQVVALLTAGVTCCRATGLPSPPTPTSRSRVDDAEAGRRSGGSSAAAAIAAALVQQPAIATAVVSELLARLQQHPPAQAAVKATAQAGTAAFVAQSSPVGGAPYVSQQQLHVEAQEGGRVETWRAVAAASSVKSPEGLLDAPLIVVTDGDSFAAEEEARLEAAAADRLDRSAEALPGAPRPALQSAHDLGHADCDRISSSLAASGGAQDQGRAQGQGQPPATPGRQDAPAPATRTGVSPSAAGTASPSASSSRRTHPTPPQAPHLQQEAQQEDRAGDATAAAAAEGSRQGVGTGGAPSDMTPAAPDRVRTEARASSAPLSTGAGAAANDGTALAADLTCNNSACRSYSPFHTSAAAAAEGLCSTVPPAAVSQAWYAGPGGAADCAMERRGSGPLTPCASVVGGRGGSAGDVPMRRRSGGQPVSRRSSVSNRQYEFPTIAEEPQ